MVSSTPTRIARQKPNVGFLRASGAPGAVSHFRVDGDTRGFARIGAAFVIAVRLCDRNGWFYGRVSIVCSECPEPD
jgi:hypothetical protein